MANGATTDPNVRKAVTVIRNLSGDEKMREIARKREEAIIDENFRMNSMLEEGIQIGLKKGGELKEAEIITRMRRAGMTEEQIRKVLE